jgi:hypothetical protein
VVTFATSRYVVIMTTKADDHRRDQEMSRARANKARRKRTPKPDLAAREHMRTTRNKNVGRAAGKNAVVELEDTPRGKRPPRKSTRKTQNRAKSSEVLERQRQHNAMRPQSKATHGKKAQRHTGPKKKGAARKAG